MRKFLVLVALVLAGEGWAACVSSPTSISLGTFFVCETGQCGDACEYKASCNAALENNNANCPSSTYYNGYYYAQVSGNYSNLYLTSGGVYSTCPSSSVSCYVNNPNSLYYVRSCRYAVRCSNQCEADSVACVNTGGTWADDPTAECGKSCRQNGCTAQDTANLETLVARCDSLGGTNDFELVDNGAQGCGLSGFCNLCNGTAYQNIRKQQQKKCCEQGHAPDTTKLQCVVESITSTDKRFVVAGQNACMSGDPQVIITPTGESYREGCDDPPPPTNSSSSDGSSSSSEGGGSSSSQSGGDSLGLDWLKDSTHKIIMYDSTTAANSIDLVNYLYDIKTCLEAGTCGAGAPTDYTGEIQAIRDTLHNSNILLKRIADKDLSVEVNGGLTADKQAQLVASIGNVADSVAKYGEANGERLDSIISALKNIGADSVAHGLDSVRNAYLREGIDSLYSLRAGLDSTFAAWSDTSGGGAFDTSGYMAILRGWGDSLGAALWDYPCDTTGGKKCDSAIIGLNGLETARRDFRAAGTALVDSINGGAVGDSLAAWSQIITNGGGVLSGDGSANCPSVFTRVYDIPLGPAGLTYPFGPFSNIICHDFGFGITFWALARVVLRALVAISCMWWIFKAVTGTEGGNDED